MRDKTAQAVRPRDTPQSDDARPATDGNVAWNTRRGEFVMAQRVVMPLFDNEATPDSAVVALKDSGVAAWVRIQERSVGRSFSRSAA
jgi:hypothetical protein